MNIGLFVSSESVERVALEGLMPLLRAGFRRDFACEQVLWSSY